METNLFIKSAKVDSNRISEINFYGDWEIDLGGGSGSGEGNGILVGNGKPFITDTQDNLVSVKTVKASLFSINVVKSELKDSGSGFFMTDCIKTKSNNYYKTYTYLYGTSGNYSNFVTRTYNHKPADVDNIIIMFFSEDGDYIKGYKLTGEYLQSLM